MAQAKVCESPERLKVTGTAAAHRLSSVKNCGRIPVPDGGRIAEEGNYNELMARGGLFSSFAGRRTVG